MFGSVVDDCARAAAQSAWPREMCGVVTPSGFVEVENVADDPLTDFRMPDDTWISRAPVLGVIHSHPTRDMAAVVLGDKPHCPTAADMRGQMASGLPWAVIVSTAGGTLSPLWWGDHILDVPLEGRSFRHGVTDCYSAIRSWYWQARCVRLPDYPRDAGWWDRGGDLYTRNFADAGFGRISADEAAEGDVLLMQMGRSQVPCHAAVNLGRGLIYHHPQPGPAFGRRGSESLSRIEPIGMRSKLVTHVLRYRG